MESIWTPVLKGQWTIAYGIIAKAMQVGTAVNPQRKQEAA